MTTTDIPPQPVLQQPVQLESEARALLLEAVCRAYPADADIEV